MKEKTLVAIVEIVTIVTAAVVATVAIVEFGRSSLRIDHTARGSEVTWHVEYRGEEHRQAARPARLPD